MWWICENFMMDFWLFHLFCWMFLAHQMDILGFPMMLSSTRQDREVDDSMIRPCHVSLL